MRSFLIAAVAVLIGATSTANAAIIGDARHKHRVPSPEDAPHMAYLITASRINFQDQSKAEDVLGGIRRGHLSFVEAMRKQAEFNKRNSRNSEPQYSGDLGLLSYDQLDEKTAKALFDIRVPVSTTADKIVGPICDESYGCSIYIVFSRFRRSFFSQSWLDADQFCLDNDLDFGQFLQGINSDDSRVFAARIWPDDIAQFQRIKLKQVQNDLKRMKDGDPSTEPPKARRTSVANSDLDKAKAEMADRRKFFDYFVTKDMIRVHPEIQTMDIGEIIRSGWIDMAKVRRLGFEKYASEEYAAISKGRRQRISAEGGNKEEEGLNRMSTATGRRKEKAGTRRVYGTGGVARDLSAEGAADPSPVDGSIAADDKKTKDEAVAAQPEKSTCAGGADRVGGECPLDLEAIKRAVAEKKKLEEEEEAAAAAAAAKKAAAEEEEKKKAAADEEDLSEF